MRQYTHRYTAYSKAHGRTPGAMLAHDTKQWPGGRMCGFMLWIAARWRAWHKTRGLTRHKTRGLTRHEYVLTEDDHRSFDS